MNTWIQDTEGRWINTYFVSSVHSKEHNGKLYLSFQVVGEKEPYFYQTQDAMRMKKLWDSWIQRQQIIQPECSEGE